MSRSRVTIGVLAVLALAVPAGRARAQEPSMSDTIRYTLGWENPASQLYRVRVTAAASGGPVVFSLPAWRPGRYIVQNYSANVQEVRAEDETGRPLDVEWIDLDSWRVDPDGAKTVTLSYGWYAATFDAGSSLLKPDLAYFNPVTLFPWVEGRKDHPVSLTLEVPEDWPIATQLARTDRHGVFTAPDYDALVDAPTIASPELVRWTFTHDDVPYYVVFRPAPELGDDLTKAKVLADMERLVAEETSMFFGAPFEEYWFLYQLVPYRFGHAVEHTASSSYVLTDDILSSRANYQGFLAVTAHEFFHAWNVKRLRPAAMWPYDYAEPQLTHLHWFTEGVTSYYENLSLVRAGLISRDDYWGALSRGIQSLQQSPGRLVTSAALSSWTSWLTGYGAGNPGQSISFYTKGALLGLLLDLRIRDATDGAKSLDDVMRTLYTRYYRQGKGMPEDAVERTSSEIAGEDLAGFFDRYVSGTEELPYAKELAVVGLSAREVEDPDRPAATLGIGFRSQDGRVLVNGVLPDSPALAAGLMKDDVLVSIGGREVASPADLRAALSAHAPGDTIAMRVERGGRPLEKPVVLGGGGNLVWRVSPVESPTARQVRLRDEWLASSLDRPR